MKSKDILLGAGIFIAWLVYSQKKAIGLLNYFISGVAISFDGVTPIMRLSIGVQNVSNESFLIKSFVGNLVSNGSVIGNVSSFVPVNIPPASQVNYDVYVRMSLIGVVQDIVNLIQKKSGVAQTVTLQGYVNASGLIAPVDLTYKIG